MGLLDGEVLNFEHVGELCKAPNDLLYFALGEPLKSVYDLLLDRRWGVIGEPLPGLCQLDSDHAPIRRVSQSCHEPFLFQTVNDAGDCAGLHHNVLGDLRGRQGAVFIKGKDAVELGGAHLILFVQLLGVELSRLQESADLVDDLFDKIVRSIESGRSRGCLNIV